MIWVIGGTSDANKIVEKLLTLNLKILVSTTTTYGSQLAQKNGVTVIQKQLNKTDMVQLIKGYSILKVIDASHPFAHVVSENAIEVCQNNKIPYVRFERKVIQYKCAHYYQSYEEIITALKHTEGNILLTIGSKNVSLFSTIKDRIVARVLPVQESIILCENAGLKAHQILAMKGKVSTSTNIAFMKEYNIQHLVTKDSGEAGGMDEKINAARECSINVHILNRPIINYPDTINNYQDILEHFK